MALGLPSSPPEGLEEFEEAVDEYCPNCGWDSTEATTNHQQAFNAGILRAIEEAETSPLSTMSATQHLAYYLRCPNKVDSDVNGPADCHKLFVVELENGLGAMS